MRRRNAMLALAAILSLAGCHHARQVPSMDANDLSDDRGARAGRFRPANDTMADANDAAPATNDSSIENTQ